MPASPSPQRGVVLVADDDPVMRLLMLEMLQQVGLDGIEAGDGSEALAGLCKDLEQLGRADTVEGADALLTDMEHAFQAVRHSLNAMLEKET